MRHILTVLMLIATTGAALAAGPHAPADLWNGARSGMNVDEVYSLFGAAQPATGQSLEDGALEALKLPATIDGRPADAVFFFRARALDAVLIEQRDVQRGQRQQNLAEVAQLVKLATASYGAPSRCAERRQIAAMNCTWRAAGLAVAVSYHDFGGGSPSLSIIYRTAG